MDSVRLRRFLGENFRHGDVFSRVYQRKLQTWGRCSRWARGDGVSLTAVPVPEIVSEEAVSIGARNAFARGLLLGHMAELDCEEAK